jgi:hypothetical protein
MPLEEWKAFVADFYTAAIAGVVLFIILIWWIFEKPVTLFNEPCAPAHPVIVDGEKVGCTNDEATSQPDYYPINE